jgi:hypothetical protein
MEEIRCSFATEEDIKRKSTAHLQFLHACLEETPRIYPPSSGTPLRVSPGDVVDGCYVPKGISLDNFIAKLELALIYVSGLYYRLSMGNPPLIPELHRSRAF